MQTDVTKWVWMMDWCKLNRCSPGDSNNWKLAEKAYNERKL